MSTKERDDKWQDILDAFCRTSTELKARGINFVERRLWCPFCEKVTFFICRSDKYPARYDCTLCPEVNAIDS